MCAADAAAVVERLEAGEHPHSPTHLGIPVLFEGLRSNALDVVEALDRAGTDWSTPYNEGGFTPLIYASLHCALPTVAWLVERGQPVTQTTPSGVGVLHVAAQRPDPTVAHFLHDAGADPFAETQQGEIPLLISLKSKGGLAMFRFMLQCYADADRMLDEALMPCLARILDRQDADAVARVRALMPHATHLPSEAEIRAFMGRPGQAPSLSFRTLEQTLSSRASAAVFALLKAERIARAAPSTAMPGSIWRGEPGL